MNNELGLCQCGCGQKTTIAKKSYMRKGHIKGQPVRFIAQHHHRGRIGSDGANWKGEAWLMIL